MSIEIFAEDAPFLMVANASEAPLFCRSSIVGVIGKLIVDTTSSTAKDAELPYRITKEFEIDVERAY